MRFLISAVIFFTSPAYAWEFTAAPICTLSQIIPEAEVSITYDPRVPIYAITLNRQSTPWLPGPTFSIQFDGPRPLTISTNRHSLSDADTTLTVSDRGFSNVLAGLEHNTTATAKTAGQSLIIPLDDAAGPVTAFRACVEGGTV
ncbi:MAG: hypothetical protein ABJI96_18420 [Paracoccaceae bacterium]